MIGFPAAWVSIEYLISLVWVHGTAGNFAYTQLDNLPVLQVASVTGPWGISFLVLLFSASVVIVLRGKRVATCGLLAIVSAVLFGILHLNQRTSGGPVKVGLVASDVNTGVADPGPPTMRLMSDYASVARPLAAQGARIIVLPEKLGVLVGADTVWADSMFQSIADQDTAHIVVGVIRVAAGARYNQARIYSPHAAVQTYDKEHMLPPYESKLTPGTSLTLLSTWGVAICKDMDFTAPSRPYGEAGANVLLVPAWDFNLDRWSHGHMAIMRGVEDGFWIVRAARQGYLTVSDTRGRVIGEARSDAAPFSTLIANVPIADGSATLYRRFGDWFAWVMLATLAGVLLRLAVRER
jgi:apolipoprotein N-acyltransferase